MKENRQQVKIQLLTKAVLPQQKVAVLVAPPEELLELAKGLTMQVKRLLTGKAMVMDKVPE